MQFCGPQVHLDDTVKACSDEALALASHTEEPPAATEQSTSSAATTTATTTKRKEKSLSRLLQHITTAKKNRSAAPGSEMLSIQDKVDAEIKLYLFLTAVNADDDPLAWWKAHVEEMPMLSKLARKYLCIPATSVPLERVFSTSGHILTPQRSRLSSEHVNMLTFLHFNLN